MEAVTSIEKQTFEKIISESIMLNEYYNSLDKIDKGIFFYAMSKAYNRGVHDYIVADSETKCTCK